MPAVPWTLGPAGAGSAEAGPGRGTHSLHLYDSPEERAAVAAGFAAAALARGERALVLADGGAETVEAALRLAGVDPGPATARGALELGSAHAWHLGGSAFTAEALGRRREAEVVRALRDGFRGLAVAADLAWALGEAAGPGTLATAEARLGPRIEAPLALLCQCARPRFPAQVVRSLLRNHGHVVDAGWLLENPLALPPEAALGEEPADREVARVLAFLHEHARLLEARAATRADPPREPPPERERAAGLPRVVIVDDDPLVGRSLARVLSPTHVAIPLTSPREVLSRIEQGERWDAIVCDLDMDEMSGMDLEGAIAVAAPELVGRIVYLTGGAFTERARNFLAAGRPFLEKPVDVGELRARIARLTSGR
ncbi:MAG TPA: MEDS domain-containing protein [Anaeromyxobacter sp.]|nr:MEDS domain-containing protein [Anaeromyxobacter sp.]